MQLSYILIAAASLLVGASPAWAASSVDLKVSGLITPSACQPALSNGGVVDHGKISARDLPYLSMELPEATLQLTINCEAKTLLALKGRDNRPGTNVTWPPSQKDATSFGLGLASGGEKIGNYRLKMLASVADGAPRGLIESVDGNTWFDAPDGTVWQPNWMRSLSAATGSGATPLPIQAFSGELLISTELITYKLPLHEEIAIDGSATLDIVYL